MSCPVCLRNHRSRKQAEKCLERITKRRSMAYARNSKDLGKVEPKYVRSYIYFEENFG